MKSMGEARFLGSEATEIYLLAFKLTHERCPHLQNSVGEAKFENIARNGGDHGLCADDNAGPSLIFTFGEKVMEGVGCICGELDGSVKSRYLDVPIVCGGRCHTLRFKVHSKFVAVLVLAGADHCAVIICIANSHTALSVWALLNDVG